MCAYAELQQSPHFSFLPKLHVAGPSKHVARPSNTESSSRNPWTLPSSSLLSLHHLLCSWRDSPQTSAWGVMLVACTAGVWTSKGHRLLSPFLPIRLHGRRRRLYTGRAVPYDSGNEERAQYESLPSVATWNQPSNMLQGRKLELLLEATLPAMDGPETFYGLGCNETEFKLFLDYIAGRNLTEEQVNISSKYVDTGDDNVRSMLRMHWNSCHLLLKNKSSKNVMAADTRLVAEVKGYLKLMESFETEPMRGSALLQWLQEQCGESLIQRCQAGSNLSLEETQSALKELLNWFKKEFPYYDQGCFHCGNKEGQRLGSVKASEQEEEFLARRSEILFCPSCSRYSRFVRYNTVNKVIETKKGRCGEYSMFMYHVMQSLGYETRWVVDWTDHVWVEVDLGGSWLHLDACEAALDDKKMYLSWGKKLTYIIAFVRGRCEDVTTDYVDDMEEVRKRRDLTDEDLKASLETAQKEFQQEQASAS
uniref:Transglutaminase-like domain-containing protein n=1 Tax=Guillardia theta TaxID=55529 RepID=A0A7S4U6J7_GUITH